MDQYNLFVRANTTFDRRVQQVDLDAMPLRLPPPEQQRRIADFLDDRVARIDRIVAARREQGQMLERGRDALAEEVFSSSAIAKSTWRRLVSVCDFFTDGDWIESPFITDHGIRLIQTGNVGVGEYKEQGFRFISEETFVQLKCTAVHEGDVLVSRLASPVARACLAPPVEPAVAAVDVTIARPKPEMNRSFLVEYLSSPRHLSDAGELARGSTMQRVSRSQLGSIKVPFPDAAVQLQASNALLTARRDLNTQSAQLTRSIDLLNEYKQALITTAVYGELDVTTVGSGIPA